MTLVADALSTAAASFAGRTAVFTSDFLFVTEAFNCTGAGLTAAWGADFTRDAATGLDVFLAVAVSIFLDTMGGTDLTGDFPAARASPGATLDPALAGFIFFAENVRVFAGFFIAFAMGSTTNCSGF